MIHWFVFAVCFALCAATACADDTASLLARFKQATGGERWNDTHTLRSTGAMRAGGLEGQFITLEDVASGRSSSRYTLGSISGASGYDGRSGWEQDPGGEISRGDAPEALARSRSEAWLAMRAFWFPARGVAGYAEVIAAEDHGARMHTVVAMPPNAAPLTLWFDPANGLLVRTDMMVGTEKQVTRYSDWREVDGLRLPFRVVIDRSDDRQRIALDYSRIERDVTISDGDFAIPSMDRASARIDHASGVASIPFELVNNHIYVDARIDGKPARLIVDTGGVSLLSPASAKRLGLEGEGRLAASGVGETRVDLSLARGREIRIGNLVMHKPTFYVLDLGVVDAVEGQAFDGLVGYEVFRRFGTTIDYANRVMTIAELAHFTPPAGATELPFTMNDRIPVIEGRLGTTPMRISIDTGSRASLTFHTPFAREHGLFERYRATPATVLGWGVGGPMTGRAFRLDRLTLGGIDLDNLVVDAYEGSQGAFASPDYSANLGGGILRRFTVAFDYEHRRMYLAPNANFSVPDSFDRSGLWLLADADALKVGGVMPGSPAAHAGLLPDDRITAIDREAIGRRTLTEWRQQLRERAVDSRLDIAYLRGAKSANVVVVLADLVPQSAK